MLSYDVREQETAPLSPPCCAGIPIFDEPEKQNCLALLVFVSLLWCTEALPLYVTSMLVPALAVLLRVLVDRTQVSHL